MVINICGWNSINMADHFCEDDIANIYEVFRHFDEEKNGRLLLKDVPTVMLSLGHNPTVEELTKLIQVVNKGDRDYVDFPEFLTMLAFHVQETEPEEQLREAFKVFDNDGNGNLSASELKQSMLNLGERLSNDDIDYMIKMADVDGDGQVNYDEFIRVMTGK